MLVPIFLNCNTLIFILTCIRFLSFKVSLRRNYILAIKIKYINLIESIQRLFTKRLLSTDSGFSYSDRLNALALLYLELCFIHRALIAVCHIIKSPVASSTPLFTFAHLNSDRIKLPSVRKSKTRKFFLSEF